MHTGYLQRSLLSTRAAYGFSLRVLKKTAWNGQPMVRSGRVQHWLRTIHTATVLLAVQYTDESTTQKNSQTPG